MGLDKGIKHGKEHRKQYYRAKAVSKKCRNHGDCDWCQDDRHYQSNKEDEKMEEMMKEYYKGGDVE